MEGQANVVEKEDKAPKTPKEKVKFILSIVFNVLFYAIIALLLLWSIMNINAGSSNGGFPNIFGKGFLSVQSNSMTRDKTFTVSNELQVEYDSYAIGEFAKGDLLNVDVFNTNDFDKLKVGDVITFYDEDIKALNSHRVVYLTKNDEGHTETLTVQGDYSVWIYGRYQGSNNPALSSELLSRGDAKTFSSANVDKIKGVATSVNYGAGNVLDNIHNNWLWYFVFPVAILLIFELFMVIKNFMDLKGTKQKAALATDKEALLAEVQAEKEKMRQELLAELQAQQASLAPKTEEPVVEDPVEQALEQETTNEATQEVETPVVEETSTQEPETKEVETEVEPKEENPVTPEETTSVVEETPAKEPEAPVVEEPQTEPEVQSEPEAVEKETPTPAEEAPTEEPVVESTPTSQSEDAQVEPVVQAVENEKTEEPVVEEKPKTTRKTSTSKTTTTKKATTTKSTAAKSSTGTRAKKASTADDTTTTKKTTTKTSTAKSTTGTRTKKTTTTDEKPKTTRKPKTKEE